MAATASRLLALLESLQAQPVATGADLAGRLGIDTRTVRRYVASLQDLASPSRASAESAAATASAPDTGFLR